MPGAEGFPEARAGSSYFFVLSTLLPMMPPRIAPAAPPMIAPFTLSLLVTAPITAPAPAPIAASRLVCLTSTGAGAGAEEYVPPDELLRRAVVRRTGARETVRGAVAFALLLNAAGAVVVPARSAAVMLSSGVYGRLAAAVDRSEFNALSAAACLSPFEQANARAAAGRISSFLNILEPPELTPLKATALHRGQSLCQKNGLELGHRSGG